MLRWIHFVVFLVRFVCVCAYQPLVSLPLSAPLSPSFPPSVVCPCASLTLPSIALIRVEPSAHHSESSTLITLTISDVTWDGTFTCLSCSDIFTFKSPKWSAMLMPSTYHGLSCGQSQDSLGERWQSHAVAERGI
jgi:hypothetical protein